ncbi:hypothetical protein [Aurantiacibacter spongiae]|uniref:Uncharacterized protein n=1 Tax=Aurantiacibacter spongiae TaxID=2488860 RepID=A0A3N5CU35_9SPHN|nr:hypothetical protein [Aurantiacibacter spongiae]RPF72217.1 hypothetical protein EG799_11730 [Aurantiacibacter spongiae]
MAKPKHITDRGADALDDAATDIGGESETVPGPSTNPSTNLIINDIMLRSVGRLSRLTVEKAILGRRYGSQFAKDAVENRSLMHTLAAYGVTKLATRSLPGAAVVGGGLFLKVLFDRSQSRREAQAAGHETLQTQSDPDAVI